MNRTHDDSTNPFSPEIPPHRPANVYNPQPFPLSPTEGNPWQRSQPYAPPPPGSMRMPEPQVNGMSVARSHGGSWDNSNGSSAGHVNAWDTSAEDGDLSTVGGGRREYDFSQVSSAPWAPAARSTGRDTIQNAWDDPYPTEVAATSAATSARPPVPQSPYRFAGTRYAESNGQAGSDKVANDDDDDDDDVELPPVVQPQEPPSTRKDDGRPYMGGARQLPSRKRWFLRLVQLLAAVGAFGFQAGASPFSGNPIPSGFQPAPFYVVYVAAGLTIILSIFHTYIYITRRFGRGEKLKRLILIVADLIMAVIWGAAVISGIIQNQCPPGGYDHWCDFYNVAVFWGALEFAAFVLALGWDVVGGCAGKRKREAVV